MEDIILVGYGGHAKSIADSIERQKKYRIIGYTEKNPCNSTYPYLGTDECLKEWYDKGIRNVVMGIGYMGTSRIRERIFAYLKEIGYSFPTIIDPSAIVSSSAQISEGVFIGKNAIVNAEAKVGDMAIINTKALVEHECVVGEFSHIAVGAVLCGRVSIGKSVLIGANATVLQTVSIGDYSIVGADTLVRKDVMPDMMIVGNKIKENPNA